MTDKKLTAASLAAQAMGWIDPVTKAVVPPIHMASTYLRDEDNGYSSGRIYARAANPTFDQAEATLAALEGGPKALVFSSGMSAATACFLALAPGDHVVVPRVMYWSLRALWLRFLFVPRVLTSQCSGMATSACSMKKGRHGVPF